MNRRGFTLLEVVFALAIFAVAAVILSQSFLGGLLSMDSVSREDESGQDLEFLYSHVLSIQDRDGVEQGGSYIGKHSGKVDWGAEVKETDVEGLFELELEVRLEKRRVVESFQIFRPGWSQALQLSVPEGGDGFQT